MELELPNLLGALVGTRGISSCYLIYQIVTIMEIELPNQLEALEGT